MSRAPALDRSDLLAEAYIRLRDMPVGELARWVEALEERRPPDTTGPHPRYAGMDFRLFRGKLLDDMADLDADALAKVSWLVGPAGAS